jgi:hypothetical protein
MDDDPMEDLLAHLDEMLDWVHDAIIGPAPLDGAEEDQVNAGKESGMDTSTRQDQGRVLVHCNQGVSRSGSVVVGYSKSSATILYIMFAGCNGLI